MFRVIDVQGKKLEVLGTTGIFIKTTRDTKLEIIIELARPRENFIPKVGTFIKICVL